MGKYALFLGILLFCKTVVFAQLSAEITDSTMSGPSFLPCFVTDTTFLPDGSGVSYTSNIILDAFAPGQLIISSSDIFSVGINIEHSYPGDLTIRLTCPNGQATDLLLYPNACSANFLGEPIDDDATMAHGLGYFYCWIPSADSTMGMVADHHQYSFTDLNGTSYNNANYIPAGNYKPDNSNGFSNLVGCPLNGEWFIVVTDNLNSDNGYIFSWQINFDTLLIPQSYNTGSATVTATGGVPPYTYFWSNGATTPTISHLAPGTYYVTVTDSYSGKSPHTATDQVVITNSGSVDIEEISQVLTIDGFINDYENISLQVNSLKETDVKISIINSIGQTVYTVKSDLKNGTNKINVSISSLKHGLYFCKLEAGSNLYIVNKFIK